MAKDSISSQGSRILTNNRPGKRKKKKGRRTDVERGDYRL